MKDDFKALRELGFGRFCSCVLCGVYTIARDEAGLRSFIDAMQWISGDDKNG